MAGGKLRILALGVVGALALRAGLTAGASAAEGKGLTGKAPANVQSLDGAAMKKAIEAQKGKVVFVNLWATWCQPCVGEFPELVKLYNTYRDKGLVLVGASIDDPEDRVKVDTFIAEQKAAFPIFVRPAGSVEQFIDPLDRKWDGVVPTTYVFDRKGKLSGKPIVGVRSYAQYEARLKPLL